MPTTPFHKVLVANRGEIAVRVLRSIHSAGYRSVAVYSTADSNAPHVALADEAMCIGPPQVGASYLNMQALLDAARTTGADAIHPGYGFLSENADFAAACAEAGITFIGPSAEAIALMGNKRVTKAHMVEAGVPCIPGYQGADQSDAVLMAEAERIGFPLMIKAAAGGGGRGMRLVDDLDKVPSALASARNEAKSAFGSDELILEKAIINGRHIEIQVAADLAGNTLHLGERDCSIQRRHQKVVEEAPSPFVDAALRAEIGAVAVNAAKACGYHGVGTVEFLVDEDRAFYFLEMNTRLQVEHPVTELVTGTDLVDWQLRIVAGEPLALRQEDVTLSGHAIEVRLYAEDPAQGFMPQTGTVQHWAPSSDTGVRIDSGIVSGSEVSPYYDPMLAKVIAYRSNRQEARRRLLRALGETHVLGSATNKGFLAHVLEDDRFVQGAATTAFINDKTLEAAARAVSISPSMVACAAVLMTCGTAGWTNGAPIPRRLVLNDGETDWAVTLSGRGNAFSVQIGEVQHEVEVLDMAGSEASLIFDGIRQRMAFVLNGDDIHLSRAGQSISLHDITYAPVAGDDAEGNGQIIAQTEGLVVGIAVAEGVQVDKGDTLVTVEAMKMEHHHVADGSGRVRAISVADGDQVKKGQMLVELELDATQEATS